MDSLADGGNVDVLPIAFTDQDIRAAAFVGFHELCIEPGECLDVFPCEDFVAAGGNAAECEMPFRIRLSSLVESGLLPQ